MWHCVVRVKRSWSFYVWPWHYASITLIFLQEFPCTYKTLIHLIMTNPLDANVYDVCIALTKQVTNKSRQMHLRCPGNLPLRESKWKQVLHTTLLAEQLCLLEGRRDSKPKQLEAVSKQALLSREDMFLWKYIKGNKISCMYHCKRSLYVRTILTV